MTDQIVRPELRNPILWTSADLLVLQQRLFSPGYAGLGRWIVFDPRSRRAFSALGPDVVPDILRLLRCFAGGATKDRARVDLPHLSEDKFENIVNAGLI